MRRLAVPVDDHALAAGEFEGVHERQTRASGAVIIWGEGTVESLRDEPTRLGHRGRAAGQPQDLEELADDDHPNHDC